MGTFLQIAITFGTKTGLYAGTKELRKQKEFTFCGLATLMILALFSLLSPKSLGSIVIFGRQVYTLTEHKCIPFFPLESLFMASMGWFGTNPNLGLGVPGIPCSQIQWITGSLCFGGFTNCLNNTDSFCGSRRQVPSKCWLHMRAKMLPRSSSFLEQSKSIFLCIYLVFQKL